MNFEVKRSGKDYFVSVFKVDYTFPFIIKLADTYTEAMFVSREDALKLDLAGLAMRKVIEGAP
jgi:hypothetical protein